MKYTQILAAPEEKKLLEAPKAPEETETVDC